LFEALLCFPYFVLELSSFFISVPELFLHVTLQFRQSVFEVFNVAIPLLDSLFILPPLVLHFVCLVASLLCPSFCLLYSLLHKLYGVL
jgi:hypothetical protein